ncbi:sporadically distributed protein, TIGR04141 family [Thermomonospora echinospora]|uniref:Sporadically distributed protein, TIGR04141 family n=1 Tax=Thermomonospora echinospora TaxID=1992 RepID=A0A1H5YPW7_9ACTN|nr:DUF6119 family protein [Thermomonospora echinospora]SEG26054.1 sporadically distributed protein, TIGR04141 family [Thermomonospora echinospora]
MASPKDPQSPPETWKSSLYRLKTREDEGPDVDLRRFLRKGHLEREGYRVQPFEVQGLSGLMVTGTIARGRADWCAAVERLTGVAVQEENRSAVGVLLVRTEQATYALTYGVGRHMIDPFRLDSGFGLQFATRCLDQDGILLVRRQIMDARGRTDENATTRGERIEDFGIERVGAIVTKISGLVSTLSLTYTSGGRRRAVRVACRDSSIQLPLATTPAEFRTDLLAIEKVCSQPNPLAELQFIDRIRSLPGKSEIVQHLEAKLEELISDPSSTRLALSVPSECMDDFTSAQTFQVSKGNQSVTVSDLDLDALLHFVGDQPPGSRLRMLKRVRVQMFSDAACENPVSPRVSGHRWLTADVSAGPGRYFYYQGSWYEIGAEYLALIEEELTELFNRPASVTLPPWPRELTGKNVEADYNAKVAEQDGYTFFDKNTVVTKKFKGGGLEICDILGPDDQLICVKQAAKQTAPLNHLFAQGTVAVEVLRNDREVRRKFLEALAERAPGHPVAEDLGALTLVYGILLKDGQKIAVDSLFAFAQVSLLQAVHRLRAMNARVEIITISRR